MNAGELKTPLNYSRMSLQSALLGYLLSLLFRSPISPQENVVLQTTAVATGTMPLAAGFVGIIPALSLLRQDTDGMDPINVGWWASVGWSCAVAFFGYVHWAFTRLRMSPKYAS